MAFPNQVARKLQRPIQVPTQPAARVTPSRDIAAKELDSLFSYAKKNGEPDESGFYPVDGWQSYRGDEGSYGLPGPAKIARQTGDGFQKSRFGEARWKKLRESILDAEGGSASFDPDPDVPSGDFFQDFRDNALREPAYTVVGGTAHMGGYLPNLIELSPLKMDFFEPGYPTSAVGEHEWGHHLNQDEIGGILNERANSSASKGLFGRTRGQDGIEAAWRRSGETPLPGQAASMALQLGHKNKMNEIAADMSMTRALNFGLTGQVASSPEDWGDMFSDMLRRPVGPVQRNPDFDTRLRPAPVFTPFEDDPTMQYGPRKGKQAHGWNQLQFYWQQLLKGLTTKEREVLLELGPHIASNQESPDAAAV